MTVQQFLARQRSGFVLARDLIAQMMRTSECTEAEAAAALEQLLLSAGDEAPRWYEWQGFGVPEELEEHGVGSALLMLAELQGENSLYDPHVSKAEVYDLWINVSRAELLTHHSVWFAYSFCGFRAQEIYASLRGKEIHIPEADAILGPAMQGDGKASSDAAPLSAADKREIALMYCAGVSGTKIAAKFRKSRRTIYDVLDDADIPRRETRRRN
ncbi:MULTISPECIES: helix-turn-helix domain-containing protein [Burkholderia]|uniref:helix-turn-helix domain-containing protein n=1 Tax=Burkholderia TaxID=32008 RepID=UPI0015EF23B5|nr:MULTISPECIES: helix-turn-helix domain-containing protein [Burkholderia]MBR8217727.1 helix-turn-helix domain-containing protein [Burkholderia vietnamiensis]MCA8229007.1 helix-turn-helix domain-containing protein [Burkholderia vietnamiensis]QMI45068.1 helix-turn-helix domain-containing protein [Burkholderia sp. MBR-1]